MSGILAANSANITNLRLSNREGGFHTYDVVVEVRDVHHVMRILSALRASDNVVQAERL
jgi:GTP pyrophosphokinase